MFTLRPKQQEILRYRGGKMGIVAVPGSGKTWTLARLAAEIVAGGTLAEGQEVLVVTLVNSAVDHFAQRVRDFLQERDLDPVMGYRVRTLHGLAHDIVRERPSLAGLAGDFQIIDEHEAEGIRNDVALEWLHNHPYDLDAYLEPDLEEERRDYIRRQHYPDLVNNLALSFIRYAKDRQVLPEELQAHLEAQEVDLPLAAMGTEMYRQYQQTLAYRGAVDFDDLVRLALLALQADEKYLERLRRQWPFILEDEAQDSSRLQEQVLRLLAGPKGNWVRVGDPNQAIYETFTTANPRYLRDFLKEKGVVSKELPNSGRATFSLINLANRLVDWTQSEHPLEAARDALHAPPYILPAPARDPQPNPPDRPEAVILSRQAFSPHEELQAIADSLERWLPAHPDETVAVLAPRNTRGFDLVDELRRRDIPYVDSLLRSASLTRFSAGALGNLFRYLADPLSASKLATAYKVWRRDLRDDDESRERVDQFVALLRNLGRVEDYLWPTSGNDWLADSGLETTQPDVYDELYAFRDLVRRWQKAVILPADQLVLALAQDLLQHPAELAVAHKLALLLRRLCQLNPTWRLPELADELSSIARNERRFLGFSEDETGFDPDRYKGKVVVATMHKAKGLEWDRVYLMSVNNYDFPAGLEYDAFIAEKWFLRNRLNLESEALAQLDSLLGIDGNYQEGKPSEQARLDYIRERLRLLYVGITRARKELVVTWNTGRKGDLHPAQALASLQEFWQLYAPQPAPAESGKDG